MTGEAGCGHPGHSGLAGELRALAVAALDRLQPALDRLRTEPLDGTRGAPASCAICPVCALIAALRGERPELAVRLAEHAAGLVTVVRAALEEHADATATPQQPAPRRRVQHIPVHRT